jgi:hypothetical protein
MGEKAFFSKWPAAIALALAFAGAPSSAHARILYKYDGAVLFDGRYGPVAAAQDAINNRLRQCGLGNPIEVDGKFGSGTRTALVRLLSCASYASALGNDAEAQTGALTESVWRLLLTSDPPSLDARARTLMLSYEATDYVRAEWNFCQSSPLYNPANGQPICYSNDRRSYLTWGPNGATAGHGREVQLILQSIDRNNPALIGAAFGGEAAAVRRMFLMPDDGARRLETYLCGVWSNPDRRQLWRSGFDRLGREILVRDRFDAVYRSASLDGGKIATFYRAYREFGLAPTEIDFAFFKDRSAHMTSSYQRIRDAIASIHATAATPRWRVRRAIALAVRPANQRPDRLGRDIAFYVDGAGGALSGEEGTAWRDRGQYRASDVGLSDARAAGDFQPGPAIESSIPSPATLTPAERAACPAAVLDTRPPPN